MSAHPVQINTKYGVEQFNMLNSLCIAYKRFDKINEFQDACAKEHKIQSTYLEYFLDDPYLSRKFPMTEDDEVGFKIFNEQSDICYVLKYFSGSAL